MRWWLLSLLLINGVVGYWFAGQRDQRLAGELVVEAEGADTGAIAELVLVSELSAVAPLAAAAPVADAAAEVVAQRRDCLVVGPLQSAVVLERIREGLMAAGVAIEDWRVQRQEQSGYWVYLSPLADRQQAQQRLNRLHQLGVDSFVFEKGDLRNGISLGIYTSNANAGKRIAELERLGYRPEIRVASRDVEEWWLQFDAAERPRLAAKFWSDMGILAPQAEISEKSCEPVASATELP